MRKGRANTWVHAQTQGGAPASETHSSRASTDQLCASKHVLVAGQRLLQVIHQLQLISISQGLAQVQKLVTTESGFLKLSTIGIWGRTVLCSGGRPAAVGCSAASLVSTH